MQQVVVGFAFLAFMCFVLWIRSAYQLREILNIVVKHGNTDLLAKVNDVIRGNGYR